MRSSVRPEFTAGESLTWQKSFCDYPASDGWELSYYFRGAGTGFDADAAADGDDFTVTVTAETTEPLSAGRYSYQGFIQLDSERILVDSGEVNVLPSLAAIETEDSFDGRSPVKIALDNIDAMISGAATLNQQEYTIGSRQLKRYPLPDLIALRDKYAALYNAELRAANTKKGKSPFKKIYARFTRPR